LTKEQLSLYAEKFKALAHPVRLEILMEITEGCYDLKKIMKRFNLSQPAVSQHIGKMRRLGILSSYKDGSKMCYEIINEEIKKILKLLKRR
jgi:ArsR family transcriptional regulator